MLKIFQRHLSVEMPTSRPRHSRDTSRAAGLAWSCFLSRYRSSAPVAASCSAPSTFSVRRNQERKFSRGCMKCTERVLSNSTTSCHSRISASSPEERDNDANIGCCIPISTWQVLFLNAMHNSDFVAPLKGTQMVLKALEDQPQ